MPEWGGKLDKADRGARGVERVGNVAAFRSGIEPVGIEADHAEARRRARELALQGLYQWLLNRNDPGVVEAHLQELLAEHVELLGVGYTLVRREYPTAIGPVDLLCRDETGASVAVEIKRRGEIDGVEQLTRYLDLLNRDSVIAPVAGVFAAQQIKPQARTLAEDRGIRCVTLDYDKMRGMDNDEFRLF